MKRFVWIAAGVIAFIAVVALAYWLGTRHGTSGIPAEASAPNGRRVLYWYDPMVPQQHFNHPGKSPMGMEMMPKYADEVTGGKPGAVRISPQVVQNLGVRTATVRVAPLAESVQVPASIAWDARESVTISARTDETIDRLYVRAPFDIVRKGQPLAEVLAPQWSAAIAEYQALAHAESSDARDLQRAARQRLRTLGLSDADIAGLRGNEAGIVIRASQDGVVAQLSVKQGEQVAAGAPLMTLNGLDHVWIEAEVPQAQMAGIAAGTPVSITSSALPGKEFHSTVQSVLPDVDPTTRTQRVRIELNNPDHQWAPGMFAEVAIHITTGAAHPLIPDEALIATGNATRVIVAEGDGHFRAVPVRVGRSADGYTAVLSGLKGGERVVTSGQFLIDSEASLSGALQRLDTGDGTDATPSQPARASSGMQGMPGMAMPESSHSSGAH